MVEEAVTRGLNLLRRHGFVARFQFLKAGDVGPGLFEPFDQARQARLDPVDVEGRDFHRPAMAGTRRLRKASDREARHAAARSEEHTSELQSILRISYADFGSKKQNYSSD